MKTIKDVFTDFQKVLTTLYGLQETESLTLLAVNEITQLSRATIKAFPDKELSEQHSEQLNAILIQLQTGKPLQYILGYTEFYGLRFLVNPSVLIPRPETEELVEWIVNSPLPTALNEKITVLDIGTGSGCIAISLKKNLASAQVSAIDISADALQTAKQNALLNQVDVNFIQDDILNSKLSSPGFQIIVSNPPYVTLQDKAQMHVNVTDFEPHSALFVPPDDPLLFYKAIAIFAMNNLVNNGLLFFEINESYGTETAALLTDKGFQNVELKKDMGDKFRMIKATFIKH